MSLTTFAVVPAIIHIWPPNAQKISTEYRGHFRYLTSYLTRNTPNEILGGAYGTKCNAQNKDNPMRKET